MKEILQEIGIDLPGQTTKSGAYVVDLGSDIDFGRIYSILEQAEEVEQREENNLLTVHNASLIYDYKEKYQLNLKADFDSDLYTLVCSEL